MNNINTRIKELRNNLHLSQEEFGAKIGLTKSSISNIESGIRNVTNKHIKLICNIFNVDELWLTTGTKLSNYVNQLDNLLKYLKSLGYIVSIEKSGQSQNGYYEEQKDKENNVVRKDFISDNEYFTINIIKENLNVTYDVNEFDDLQKNIEQFINFELFKHNSK